MQRCFVLLSPQRTLISQVVHGAAENESDWSFSGWICKSSDLKSHQRALQSSGYIMSECVSRHEIQHDDDKSAAIIIVSLCLWSDYGCVSGFSTSRIPNWLQTRPRTPFWSDWASLMSKIVPFWHCVAHRWKCCAKCVNYYSWTLLLRSTGSDYSFLK